MKDEYSKSDYRFEKKMDWIQLLQLTLIVICVWLGMYEAASLQVLGLFFSWVILLRKDLMEVNYSLRDIKIEIEILKFRHGHEYNKKIPE
jgi:hypothetical protein